MTDKEDYTSHFMKMGIPKEQAEEKAVKHLEFLDKLKLINHIVDYDHEYLWYLIKIMEQTGSDLKTALEHLNEIEYEQNQDCWSMDQLQKDYKEAKYEAELEAIEEEQMIREAEKENELD